MLSQFSNKQINPVKTKKNRNHPLLLLKYNHIHND